ncbi:MAG: BMP family ABC transporter substrate-binding protein, partial [Pseudomonadota bacterium]
MDWTRRTTIKLALAASMLAGGHAFAQDEPKKIGFIYPAPVGDVGWAKELDRGREAVEAEFGDRIETVVAENIPEGPDAQRVMNQMVAEGADMVMLGSFGYMNDGLRLAQQNPDVAFIHASGFKLAPNFGNFQTRNYESAYIAGIAAGDLTETGTLGVVAAYPIPEVIGIINAFTLGAQKTEPEVSVKVVWLNSWLDPSKAQDSARSLYAQDADIIFSLYQDTPSVVSIAEETGFKVVNTSSDMKTYANDNYVMGLGIDWSPHFVAQVGAMLDGSFEGTAYWGGMKDGAVAVRSLTDDLSDEAKALIDEAMAGLSDGSFHPMT